MSISFAGVKAFHIGGTEIKQITINGSVVWKKPVTTRTYYLPSESGWQSNDGIHYLRFKIVQTQNADNTLRLTISIEGMSPSSGYSYSLRHLLGDVYANGVQLIASGQSDHYMDFQRDSVWRQMRNFEGTGLTWAIDIASSTTSVPFQLGSYTQWGSVFQLNSGSYNAAWSQKNENLTIVQ